VIFSLARTRRISTAPAAVGAYIGAAYFFTSSASFANPAISVGRMFSNTFAGIAPASVASFIGAQLVGGIFAVLLVFFEGLGGQITRLDGYLCRVVHPRARFVGHTRTLAT
jgi:glycerol uptake facilitator-like aquaporin